jgi:hypothetical protein
MWMLRQGCETLERGWRTGVVTVAVMLISQAPASSAVACGGDVSGTPIEPGRTKARVRWS